MARSGVRHNELAAEVTTPSARRMRSSAGLLVVDPQTDIGAHIWVGPGPQDSGLNVVEFKRGIGWVGHIVFPRITWGT